MKSHKFFNLFFLFFIAAVAASCSSHRRTTSTRYPQSTRVVVVEQPRNLPPGQAKKIYGTKSARPFAPGHQKKRAAVIYPLIIVRTPSIIIHTHIDGRLYYENSDGMKYWKGDDDRFYMDDHYISRVKYNEKDYDEWKGKGNKGGNASDKKQDKGKSNGNGRGKKNS